MLPPTSRRVRVVAGVVMWIRRPTPRMGELVVLCGVVYYVQYLRAADGILFTIGFCLTYAWVGVAAHLALAWPTGTLATRVDKIFVTCSLWPRPALRSSGTRSITAPRGAFT